jgi:dTDP-4-amino-4,6-dideoxygalactose transaminase
MNPSDFIPHSRPTLGDDEARAVAGVVASGNLAEGAVTAEFEQAVVGYLDLPHGVAVSSGTAALHLVLAALGVGAGDEVIIPSYVCSALLHAVAAVGAVPVPADIDPVTLNMDPEDVARRLSARTKALVLPHMFGMPAGFEEFQRLGVPVIEDCAQAIGGRRRSRPLGGFGVAAVLSFYATKVMTTGEGGMVVTRSAELAERVRDLKAYDKREDYRPRLNYKMTEIQAAMGIVQLGRLDGFIRRRREIARRYFEAFRPLPVRLPPQDPDHIYFRFVIAPEVDPAAFMRKARESGVACERPVHPPLHRLLGLAGYPAAERAYRRCVSIPIYPSLADPDVERVITVLSALLAAGR